MCLKFQMADMWSFCDDNQKKKSAISLLWPWIIFIFFCYILYRLQIFPKMPQSVLKG